MIQVDFSPSKRALRSEKLHCDFAVAGGGFAGVCAAITAARAGLRVVLVQDRPVLGGNASSEVRLWILGATSHMGNNNRWAREGGVVDEILVENTHRNPEGNPLLLDALLLEWVSRESNITLLLNTAIHDLEKSDPDTIRSLCAFCPQNSTSYEIHAPLFCDATGDGLVGFLAGAAFRMGAEPAAEFGEGMAPSKEYGELLGHSLYFYARDTGRPVRFVPPSFALKDITQIPRWRDLGPREHGCKLWWLEYGGLLDTIHETEKIKWELWKVAYGVWNHIKNSGQFPEAETMTLEWIGTIPGKRESRRFEGDFMLSQRDLMAQVRHPDVVSFGGWAVDLHPAEGVYSPKPGCQQYHSKGVFGIPYRSLYSRNIRNLFLGGRLISASHVAFGSTRVMATCGHNAQAVGMAAALCLREKCAPRDLSGGPRLQELQRRLLCAGQYLPGVALSDPADLALQAKLSASSELQLDKLPPAAGKLRLDASWGMMLPLAAGPAPKLTLLVDAASATHLRTELRISAVPGNHTPDLTLAAREVAVGKGIGQAVELAFDAALPRSGYAFYMVHANPEVTVALSEHRLTGVLSVTHAANKAVAKSAVQTPPQGSGVDTFEFWTPQRRPKGENFALCLEPALACFGVANLTNGLARPVCSPNAWVASLDDRAPTLTLAWQSPKKIARIVLSFDTDFDHPMESVQMGHPERDMPFCVRCYRIRNAAGDVLLAVDDNHQTRREHVLPSPVETDRLLLELVHPSSLVPAALFEVRVYES